MDPKSVLEYASKHNAKILDLRFIDVPGVWQHVSYPIQELTAESFQDGFGMDASSIRGWAQIHESDMLLIPDPNTAFMDPFRDTPTLIMICDAQDPLSRKPYERDVRNLAHRAEEFLQKSGIADQAFFGAEAEFFIFDSVRFDSKPQHGFYFIDSDEGRWNTGRAEHNLGYRTRYKEGYFPVPPMDHFQDMRTDMVLKLQEVGIDIECHHHEVATAGQAEIDFKFDTLIKAADNMCKYKYVVRNVAYQYGKTVTFMPKPIFSDNGSGMHTHQSLWGKGKPLFAGDMYAGLSQTRAVVYRRAAEACAGDRGVCRANDELLQASRPGLRSAGEPGVLAAQSLGCGPHPDVLDQSQDEAPRIPAARCVVQSVSGVFGDAHGRPGRNREQDRSRRPAR